MARGLVTERIFSLVLYIHLQIDKFPFCTAQFFLITMPGRVVLRKLDTKGIRMRYLKPLFNEEIVTSAASKTAATRERRQGGLPRA
jgi:hypothetical protein